MAGWGGCREGLSLCPLPFGRARAGDAAKGAGQGRGTFVADLVGDQRQGAALLQALLRQGDAPAGEVVAWGTADDTLEMRGETRA